jgi:hypothetical protein
VIECSSTSGLRTKTTVSDLLSQLNAAPIRHALRAPPPAHEHRGGARRVRGRRGAAQVGGGAWRGRPAPGRVRQQVRVRPRRRRPRRGARCRGRRSRRTRHTARRPRRAAAGRARFPARARLTRESLCSISLGVRRFTPHPSARFCGSGTPGEGADAAGTGMRARAGGPRRDLQHRARRAAPHANGLVHAARAHAPRRAAARPRRGGAACCG